MCILWAFVLVFGAGLLGGAVNALLSDNGFLLPKKEDNGGSTILRPGFLGNMLVGGVAAVISWGLYGPAADIPLILFGKTTTTPSGGLTVAGLVGAILVGVAGARWLTNEIDKKLLRGAAMHAAGANKDDALAMKLALAPPAEALKEARQAPR